MSENEKPKKPRATEVIANIPRRDNSADKYGDPHTNWDDKPLSKSETWKSHRPAKEPPATDEQKSPGPVEPPKKKTA